MSTLTVELRGPRDKENAVAHVAIPIPHRLDLQLPIWSVAVSIRARASFVSVPLSVLLATALATCSSGQLADSEPLTMQVMGRDILVPAPPRMKRSKVEASGLKHVFVPTTPRRDAPYYAVAMIRGAREEIAKEVYQEARSAALGPTDKVALLRWRAALRGAMAGRRGPLPGAPEGFLTIEHDTASVGTVISLIHMRKGDDRSLIGSATLLVNERALALDIIFTKPVDRAELAAVRAQIRDWVSNVRSVNP